MSESWKFKHNNRRQLLHSCAYFSFKLMIFGILLIFAISNLQADVNTQDFQITAHDGTELTLIRYPAQGTQLVIWIASGYGLHERSIQTAHQLASIGIEVWQIDLAEALFLPHSTDQIRSLNGQYVADLIHSAYRVTGKKIILCSQSYGAIPLLRGARIWQSSRPKSDYLNGAILFSPDLYTTIPPLGLEPEYLPIVAATNIPIVILQEGKRPNRWHVDKLVQSLNKGGSKVQLNILEGVSGLFFEDDKSPETTRIYSKLAHEMSSAIKWLESTPTPRLKAPMAKLFKPKGSGIDSKLKIFKGNFGPIPINLPDISGKVQLRDNYQNKITIVNFWASWCSPCVQEIPSLNRLRDKMTDLPLELISINYAEDAQTIKEFMHKVDVRYPVLLDSTGLVASNWKVIAFPSTYIMGADGKIHYAVNAAIEWDTPEVVNSLMKLYQTTSSSSSPTIAK